MDSTGNTPTDPDETLDDALKILNEDPAVATDDEKEAEAVEEVGVVLGDLA
jgi:hypothetical protein